MRTKLFLAFLTVIITALISNLIFERLIIRDFDDYSMGMREDRLYWILASVEGSHSDGRWNATTLTHILQWGTMLGLDLKVIDTEGSELLATATALRDVSTTMRRRIESLVVLDSASGEFEEYPLFVEGEEIGTLMVREFQIRGGYYEKEKVFKRRGRNFLMISFLIAGGGALFLAIALSLFLTGPLRRLRLAAEKVASGDLSGRVKYSSSDEVGRLITSFNKMVESLERENALRQRLTQNVAHELRTPLTVMRSHLEAVADGIVDCSPKAMDTLMAEVKRLVNLVEGIEDMTKAEASFFKPAKTERMDLSEFIEGVLGSLRPLFSEKGLELKVDVEQAAQADMDTDKLYTVLKNILTNALRYTDRGSVHVTGRGDGKGGAVIEVKDTGHGIPPEEMGVIFKRFHKGSLSEGVGLGLAISKELSEVMGARLEVESEPGKGSTFRIIL